MKPLTAFVLGMLSVTAASAKTVTVPQNDNDRVVSTVSGATPDKNPVAAQPSKKALKKAKIKTPPPMHDPN